MDELLGVYLKNVRESKKITLDEIAKETKIQKRYLEAIEAEQYDEIPGETYLRGFLRNYASAIGLNPEIIIEKYDAKKKIDDEEELRDEIDEVKTQNGGKSLFRNLTIAFAALVVFYIIVTGIGFLYNKINVNIIKPVAVEKTTASSLGEKKESVPVENLVAETLQSNATTAQSAVPHSEMQTDVNTVEKTSQQAIVTGEKEIVLTAVGTSWVKIMNGERTYFEGTINEGIVKTLKTKERIYIVVGDAINIQLRFNGEDYGVMGKAGEVIRKEF